MAVTDPNQSDNLWIPAFDIDSEQAFGNESTHEYLKSTKHELLTHNNNDFIEEIGVNVFCENTKMAYPLYKLSKSSMKIWIKEK